MLIFVFLFSFVSIRVWVFAICSCVYCCIVCGVLSCYCLLLLGAWYFVWLMRVLGWGLGYFAGLRCAGFVMICTVCCGFGGLLLCYCSVCLVVYSRISVLLGFLVGLLVASFWVLRCGRKVVEVWGGCDVVMCFDFECFGGFSGLV